MKQKNEISLVSKKPRMTNGQLKLYELVVYKVENGLPIKFEEAKTLYINYACREVRDGKPFYFNCWWRNEKEEMVGRWQELSQYEVATRTMMWLTQNIGALVLKGFLKIIPQIEVKNINSKETE